MELRIKKDSPALRAYKGPDVNVEKSHGQPETMFVFDDEFIINEMMDGRFWAAPNFNLDDDRTFEQFKSDVINSVEVKTEELSWAEREELAKKMRVPLSATNGEIGRIELPKDLNPPNYYGAYFATLDEAVEAVRKWQADPTSIPKEYHQPLED